MPTTIAIVEDDFDLCEDLAEIIGETADLVCACTCRNGKSALHKIPLCRPDLVLMDIQLPDISGIECTAKLKRLLPHTQIVMFTVRDDNEQVFQALQAGASGYLLKGTPPLEILNALRDVVRGGAPMTGEIARKVVHSFHRSTPIGHPAASLTSRETEVLELLAEGCISKEIAHRLSISVETVNYHLKQIYQKMDVHSRTEAVVKYLRR
jgi:DNA-binding NarL/FixJ family response regulator